MSKSARTEAQIIAAVKPMESDTKVSEVAREVGFEAHDLPLEVEVRRDGSARGAGTAASA